MIGKKFILGFLLAQSMITTSWSMPTDADRKIEEDYKISMDDQKKLDDAYRSGGYWAYWAQIIPPVNSTKSYPDMVQGACTVVDNESNETSGTNPIQEDNTSSSISLQTQQIIYPDDVKCMNVIRKMRGSPLVNPYNPDEYMDEEVSTLPDNNDISSTTLQTQMITDEIVETKQPAKPQARKMLSPMSTSQNLEISIPVQKQDNKTVTVAVENESKKPLARLHINVIPVPPLSAQMTYPEIEQYIMKYYMQPGFKFLEAYNRLPAGREANSMRSRVLNTLDNEAAALVQTTIPDDVKAAFDTIPEGYFRMQVRMAYRQHVNHDIDHLDITTIMDHITNGLVQKNSIQFPDENYINLSNLKITVNDLIGINDLLTVRNEIKPILKLTLDTNSLTTMPAQFGQGLVQLQTLSLARNEMEQLPEDFGQTWAHLKDINLQHNQLQQLPEHFGQQWVHLEGICLSNNIQRLILPATFGLTWKKLKGIWLSCSHLRELPETFGLTWKKLEILFLDENSLEKLPNGFGHTWTKLERLNLCQNRLQQLPEGFGQTWSHLINLDTSYNYMPQRYDLIEQLYQKWPKATISHYHYPYYRQYPTTNNTV